MDNRYRRNKSRSSVRSAGPRDEGESSSPTSAGSRGGRRSRGGHYSGGMHVRRDARLDPLPVPKLGEFGLRYFVPDLEYMPSWSEIERVLRSIEGVSEVAEEENAGSLFRYKNAQTGVEALFRAYAPEAECDLGLLFTMPMPRPQYFAQEALPVAVQVAREFNLLTSAYCADGSEVATLEGDLAECPREPENFRESEENASENASCEDSLEMDAPSENSGECEVAHSDEAGAGIAECGCAEVACASGDEGICAPEVADVAEDVCVPEVADVAEDVCVPEVAVVAEDVCVPEVAVVAECGCVPEVAVVAECACVAEVADVAECACVPEVADVATDGCVPEVAGVAECACVADDAGVAEGDNGRVLACAMRQKSVTVTMSLDASGGEERGNGRTRHRRGGYRRGGRSGARRESIPNDEPETVARVEASAPVPAEEPDSVGAGSVASVMVEADRLAESEPGDRVEYPASLCRTLPAGVEVSWPTIEDLMGIWRQENALARERYSQEHGPCVKAKAPDLESAWEYLVLYEDLQYRYRNTDCDILGIEYVRRRRTGEVLRMCRWNGCRPAVFPPVDLVYVEKPPKPLRDGRILNAEELFAAAKPWIKTMPIPIVHKMFQDVEPSAELIEALGSLKGTTMRSYDVVQAEYLDDSN